MRQINEDRKQSVKGLVRTWLLKHPKYNPYRFSIKRQWRKVTKSIRVLPDFIIIGSAKSGTTSLYSYLIQHPSIFPSEIKEVTFFNYKSEIKINEYRSFFPSKFTKFFVKCLIKKKFVTGEASTAYFIDPTVPEKVKKILPEVKLIAILRNPVDRAFSNYLGQLRVKNEKIPFEEAIEEEGRRRSIMVQKMINQNKGSISSNPPYLYTGIYHLHIKKWLEFFPSEQIFVINSDEIKKEPVKILNQVFQFLDLDPYNPKDLRLKNMGEYDIKMNSKMRKKLVEYFKTHNEQLSQLLGRSFDWDK